MLHDPDDADYDDRGKVGINVLFHIYQSVVHHNIMHLLLCVSQLFNVIRQLKDIYRPQVVAMTAVLIFPEGLLILCRSGIFVIDSSVANCQICPRHRDDLGVYWKRKKRICQAPIHPANSSAKCARGIQASRCKEFWLKSRTFLAVGAGKNLINRKSLCT